MDSIVLVAMVNGLVSIVGAALSYLAVRRKLDHQAGQAQGRSQEISSKLEEVKGINENQIVASNNFNQKFAKLEHQGNRLEALSHQTARETHETSLKVGRIEQRVEHLYRETGIAID